ncbi:MAG TPA: hypothetical protein VMV41_06245 [Cellulomonadaceae bacterium]|nr:hypothetical protein [Cellulomonadaceae bacterium]
MTTPARTFTTDDLSTPNGRIAALLEMTPGASDTLASQWDLDPRRLADLLSSGVELTVDQVIDAADLLDVDSTYLFGIEGASLGVALRLGLEHFRGSIRTCR